MATKRNHAPIYRKVPGFVRELRVRAGLTQADVGARLGASQVYVARCESGSRRVDVAEFIEIARAVGANPVKAFAELCERP